jgi:methionine-rich copper-binding protein CopC
VIGHDRAGGAMRALTRPRVLITLMLAVLWLAVWCSPALAHARLLRESPASGASLEEPPEQVRLRFSEPVDAEFDPVRVFDAEGERVDEDDARVDPDDARVLLAGLEDLPQGSYRVEWRVTSVDGHVVEDAYAFNVTPDTSAAEGGSRGEAENTGQPEAQPAAGEEPERAGPQKAGGLDQTVVYSALTFGVLGLLVLVLVVARWLRHRQSRGIQ